MKMGDVHANDPSREDHDAKGQRPGAVDEMLEQRASAEALLLFRQLKVLRDDDELPDDFVIDSKRIHNLYLELEQTDGNQSGGKFRQPQTGGPTQSTDTLTSPEAPAS